MLARTPRRVAAVAAGTLAAAALGACSSSQQGASGAPASSLAAQHTTLAFTGRDEQGNMALEDLGAKSAPGGPDLGDVLAFTQTLTLGGKPAGQAHVVAVGVDHKRHLSEATGTITLRAGTIQLGGVVSMGSRFSLAVTGGTGAYAGDTGTIDFDASGGAQKLTVHLVGR